MYLYYIMFQGYLHIKNMLIINNDNIISSFVINMILSCFLGFRTPKE